MAFWTPGSMAALRLDALLSLAPLVNRPPHVIPDLAPHPFTGWTRDSGLKRRWDRRAVLVGSDRGGEVCVQASAL